MKLKSHLLALSLAFAAGNSQAVIINFSGTGWNLAVDITDTTPTGTYFNAFQDSDTARVGFNSPLTPFTSIDDWNAATRPGTGQTPTSNTLSGNYTLTAQAGYVLTSLDLTGAGTYIGRNNASGTLVLDGASTNYSFSVPSNLNTGSWLADATDLNLAGATSHSGSFTFTNNAGRLSNSLPGSLIGTMVGSAATGPEFTVGAAYVPLPSGLALLAGGLGVFGLFSRLKKNK